ncbi:DUF4189 domain-containing protein [Mycolicibacterium stellerae]|uniref:DUF4189 domain-containing protein n=1 Tax=Mycolicibacterium stellerae TaxID=2358193 RepID=UPI000F0B862D|nr:DUF4189 domain-containing protein [Mycolicibacterium stellerae]
MTLLNRTRIRAAIAICAVGYLAMPLSAYARPPAPLAPPCGNWVIPAGTFVINQDNGIVVEMEGWNGDAASGQPIRYLSPALFGPKDVTTGHIATYKNADIYHVNQIFFRADWDPHPGSSDWNDYRGTIDGNGYASGTTTNDGGATNGWRSVQPLKCTPGPRFSAIAYSYQSWATAQDYPDRATAEKKALDNCSGGDCSVVSVPNETGQPANQPCVAVTVGSYTNYAFGSTLTDAKDRARQNYNGIGTPNVVPVCKRDGTPAIEAFWVSGKFPPQQPPPPPSEITLRFDPPQLLSITGHVGITNNAGKPAISCEFSDGIVPDPDKKFDVTGDAEYDLVLPPPTPGINYNLTVTCPPLTPYKKSWKW